MLSFGYLTATTLAMGFGLLAITISTFVRFPLLTRHSAPCSAPALLFAVLKVP